MVIMLTIWFKLLLKKIMYYPTLLFRYAVDDYDHQLAEAANWFNLQHVPVVPEVEEYLIDTESVKNQLPVMQYRNLVLKKRSCSHNVDMETVSCIVCMNSMEGSDEVREFCNCEHVFHRECLDAWIDQSRQLTCPLCRSELLSPATTVTKVDDRDPWRTERMIYLFGEDKPFQS